MSEETFEQYLQRLKDRRTEDDYKYTDEDFELYKDYIEDCYNTNLSVYKCLEFMWFQTEEGLNNFNVTTHNTKGFKDNMKQQHIQSRHIHKLVAIANSMGIMPEIENKTFTDECLEILDKTVEHDLLFEVLWSAFQYKSTYPDSSMLESLQVGAQEWDI